MYYFFIFILFYELLYFIVFILIFLIYQICFYFYYFYFKFIYNFIVKVFSNHIFLINNQKFKKFIGKFHFTKTLLSSLELPPTEIKIDIWLANMFIVVTSELLLEKN